MDLPLKLWPHPLDLHLTKTPVLTLDLRPCSCLSLVHPQLWLSLPVSDIPPHPTPILAVPRFQVWPHPAPPTSRPSFPLSTDLTSLALIPPHFHPITAPRSTQT